MKKILVSLVMVLVLPSVGLALSEGWERGPGMGMHYGPYPGGAHSAGQRLMQALNLTPEQSQKMKDLRESFSNVSIPLRNEIRGKRFELQAFWMQANPDQDKILAKQKEIIALRSDLLEKATKNRLEMRKILTPEQQAKWTYLRSQFRPWRGYDKEYGFGAGPAHHEGMGYGPRW
jgi:Spy/CpxP family protein refolding chaperone